MVSSKSGKARGTRGKRLSLQQEGSVITRYLPALIVAVTGLLLYINTLNHGFVLDDITVIGENRLVQQGIKGIPELLKTSYWFGFSGSAELGYRPLSLVMFAIEWQLSPNNPFIHHAANVLLYSITGFLLFVTLRRMLHSYHPLLPFAIAILYMAHPIHTEVAANIKSRDEMLSFLFSIASLYYLLRYAEGKRLLPALVCFFLALISKENAVTMAGIAPFVLYFFTPMPARKNISVALSFIAVIAGYILLRMALPEGFRFRQNMPVPDNTLVAAPDMMSRLATAVQLLGRYLVLLFFPHPLISDYSYNHIPIINWSNWGALASLAAHIALIVYAVKKWKSRNLFAFAVIFYLVTFSVASNILFLVGATLAERFMYMPSLGFCIAVGVLLTRMLKNGTDGQKPSSLPALLKNNTGFTAVLLLILTLYSVKAVSRNAYWKSNLILFSHDLENAPQSTKLNYYYAVSLFDSINAGQVRTLAKKTELADRAIASLQKVIDIYPGFVEAYEQTGYSYWMKGYYEKAKEYYEQGIRRNSHSAKLYSNYAGACVDTKDYDKAIELYRRAIAINPNYSEAYNGLGVIYNMLYRYEEAVPNLKKALEVKPAHVEAMKNIARSLANLKNYKSAISYLNRAAKLSPDDPDIYLYMGYCYMYDGNEAASKASFEKSEHLKAGAVKN